MRLSITVRFYPNFLDYDLLCLLTIIQVFARFNSPHSQHVARLLAFYKSGNIPVQRPPVSSERPYELRWKEYMSQWHSPFRREQMPRSSLLPTSREWSFHFRSCSTEGLDESAVLSRPAIQVVCPEDVAIMRARGNEHVLPARCIHIECSLPPFPVRRSHYGLKLNLFSRVWHRPLPPRF